MNNLPPFPEVIDSSIRSTLVACHRQFYYQHLLNLRGSSVSIHLHFGACIAKAFEIARKSYWAEGKDEIHAVSDACKAFIIHWGDFEIPDDIIHTRAGVKTLEAGLDAIMSYFEQFPLGSDVVKPLIINNKPMVEISAALPIPNTAHPVTGDPIIYAGRLDMLGIFNDAVFVVDEKTSVALGQSWRSNWQLRGQFTGYCWLVRSYGIEASGAIIRGIGILKGSIQFEQVVVTRPEWQINQWLIQLSRDVNRAIDAWKQMRIMAESGLGDNVEQYGHNCWDQALDSACSSYGGCGYLKLCDSENPASWYDDYARIPWHPLERSGDAA